MGAYLGGEFAALWLAAYNSPGHWVRQVDLARVLIVFCQGGLYTDLDVAVRPTSPNVATMMRDILGSGLFLSSWPRHPEDADAHFEEEVGCEADVLAACKGDARLLDLAQRQVRNVLAARAGPFEKNRSSTRRGPAYSPVGRGISACMSPTSPPATAGHASLATRPSGIASTRSRALRCVSTTRGAGTSGMTRGISHAQPRASGRTVCGPIVPWQRARTRRNRNRGTRRSELCGSS